MSEYVHKICHPARDFRRGQVRCGAVVKEIGKKTRVWGKTTCPKCLRTIEKLTDARKYIDPELRRVYDRRAIRKTED